jgi:hypothetical protein
MRWIAGLVMSLVTTVAAAQQGAAAQPQFTASIYGDYAEQDDFAEQRLGLEANLPLGQVLGLRGGLGRGWRDGNDDQVADADIVTRHLGLFARDPGSGFLGAEYVREDYEPDVGGSWEEETQRGYFGMYDRRFDIVLTRARTRVDQDAAESETVHTGSVSLGFYGNPNALLSGHYGLMAIKGDYALDLTYQPQFAGQALALGIGYQDADEAGDIVTGRVVFFFGAGKPLMARKRQDLFPDPPLQQ